MLVPEALSLDAGCGRRRVTLGVYDVNVKEFLFSIVCVGCHESLADELDKTSVLFRCDSLEEKRLHGRYCDGILCTTRAFWGDHLYVTSCIDACCERRD